MAEYIPERLDLSWERLLDGRLMFILVKAGNFKGQHIQIPIARWVLTDAEKDDLKAAMGGIAIARSLPETNGKAPEGERLGH